MNAAGLRWNRRCGAMVRGLRSLLLAGAVLLVMTVVAAESEDKQVLYLISDGFGTSVGADLYSRNLVASLHRRGLRAANVHTEFLDLVRHPDPEHRTKLREHLLKKFTGRRFDAILAGQQAAADFMLRDLDSLSPGTPVLLSTAAIPAGYERSRRFLVQRTQLDFAGTMNHILAMFPRTHHVLVISGTGAQDQSIKAAAQREYDKHAGRLTFDYTDALTLPQTLDRARALPPDSVVLFAFATRDAAGTVLSPDEFRKAITGVASAPVFGLSSVGMGSSGIIGGSLYDVAAEAARMADLTVAVMDHTLRLDESGVDFPTRGVPMFDWAQIQRWKVDTRVLPSDSIFFNRPPSIWNEHRAAVSIAGASLLTLLGMVAALLVQNRRAGLAEAAVRQLNNELEDRVHFRTMELERANADIEMARDAAESADRSKSSFLANMSHEIRTPMNAILGMSYLALQSGLDPQQHNYVQKVHASAESLLRVINDILDFSKIEAGKLDMETIPFSLGDVADNVVSVLSMKADEKGLELLLDVPLQLPMVLLGDPSRLGQVLLNLGNNAVKFTEGGEIVMVVRMLEQDGASARLSFEVRDSGIGMSAEQQQRLFQPFMQADASTSRRYGGTGLGLAISQHLVHLMGGELAVESEPTRGSRFRFELRFAIPTGQTLRSQHWSDDALRGTRVLVVDDNAAARQLHVAMSEALGLRVDAAASGEEALARVGEADASGQPYELLLMDWKMPGMDGVACAQALVQASLHHLAPFVIMATAFDREEVRQRLAERRLEAGALLTKPVTPSTLLDACATALGRTRLVPTRRARHEQALADHRTALAGTRILLVEDNVINQELAVDLLRRTGVAVSVAGDGHEALEILARERFDAVLMDCQMPVLDGYAATRAIRLQPTLRTLPVIAMTANAMVGDREAVLAAGMNDHIAKPIDVDEMFVTLARWVKRTRSVAASNDSSRTDTL
jgi:signal transduction histidine kinase/DNA-binding response OmpR family regulator